MSTRSYFQRCVQQLQKAGIQDPYTNGLYLLERCIRPTNSPSILHAVPPSINGSTVSSTPSDTSSSSYSRTFVELFLRKNLSLTPQQLQQFNSFIQRRCTHEPLQYILEEWDFAGLSNILIRRPLFCPRPETEQLVHLVESLVRHDTDQQKDDKGTKDSSSKQASISPFPPYRMIEVGIGTGAVSCALLSRLSSTYISSLTGLDIQPIAVHVSQENSKKFRVDDRFYPILTDALRWSPSSDDDRLDYIVSNPPYIPTEYLSTLDKEVQGYEDHQALDGKEPYGLGFILQLLRTIKDNRWLTKNNKHCKIVLETDILHPFVLASICLPTEGDRKYTGSVSLSPTRSSSLGIHDKFLLSLTDIHYTIDNVPNKIYDADDVRISHRIKMDTNVRYLTWKELMDQVPPDTKDTNKFSESTLEKVLQSIPYDTKIWLRQHYRYENVYYDHQKLPRFIVLVPSITVNG